MGRRAAASGAIALALGFFPAGHAAAAEPALRGVVVGPDRASVGGARLTLARAPGPAESQEGSGFGIDAHSDESGVFRFEAIPSGEWTLTCEADGMVPFRLVLRIPEPGRAHPDLVIRMKKAPAIPAAPLVDARGAEVRARREAFEGAPGGGESPPTAGAGVTGLPIEDRWRVPLPAWDRYPGRGLRDVPGVSANDAGSGAHWNPYRKNLLKGDYPIAGQNTFLSLSGVSDSFLEARTLPTPTGASAARPESQGFFGGRRQYQGAGTVIASAELFHGNAGFRPVDWRAKATVAAQFNWLAVRERGIVSVDVRDGTDRTDEHAGLQEMFLEAKLADIGLRYDFVSLRAGVQAFTSDARGFLFVDNQPGVRFFGSLFENRVQWNAAFFEMLEKDTNSGLNTTRRRHQRVGAANVSWQDAFVPGYTLSASVHVNDDTAGSEDAGGGFHYDDNGFLVRPAPVGDFLPHDLRVTYYGLAGDGHIGRLNLTHQVYFADGRDEHNPIAHRPVQVRSLMAAGEASWDHDWIRLRASAFYAAGDEDPSDGVGQGFDSILDNPNFAGGPFSFWNRQGIRLAGSGLGLVGRFSPLPDLRSSKDEGQSNSVNPGLLLAGAGADFDLTPKLKLILNGSYLRFDDTSSLETVLFQPDIRKPIGFDLSLGAVWRPWLTDNVIVTGGAAVFRPSSGFSDLLEDATLASAFASISLTY